MNGHRPQVFGSLGKFVAHVLTMKRYIKGESALDPHNESTPLYRVLLDAVGSVVAPMTGSTVSKVLRRTILKAFCYSRWITLKEIESEKVRK